jgi:hypothetical protein
VQVLVGRQHQLGLEIDGVTYNLLLGNEEEARQAAEQAAASLTAASQLRALPAAVAAVAASALTPAEAVAALGEGAQANVLAPQHLFAGDRARRSLELPETTLTGPLELVLHQPEPVRAAHSAPSVQQRRDPCPCSLNGLHPLWEGPRDRDRLCSSSGKAAFPCGAGCVQISVLSPLATDVGGPVRRVLLAAGATVRVSGLKRVELR